MSSLEVTGFLRYILFYFYFLVFSPSMKYYWLIIYSSVLYKTTTITPIFFFFYFLTLSLKCSDFQSCYQPFSGFHTVSLLAVSVQCPDLRPDFSSEAASFISRCLVDSSPGTHCNYIKRNIKEERLHPFFGNL